VLSAEEMEMILIGYGNHLVLLKMPTALRCLAVIIAAFQLSGFAAITEMLF
jgi:hypothetical protein